MIRARDRLGVVIRIVDEYTIIINVGKRHVSVGDRRKVYQPLDDLYLPDGQKLDTYNYTKDILEVIDTDDSYSVCKKPLQEVPSTRRTRLALSPMLDSIEVTRSKLNIEPSSIQALPNCDNIIHVGDPVKKA